MLVKRDFFHFLLLSPRFDPAGTFVTRNKEVLPEIRPALFGVHFSMRPVGKLEAERNESPDGHCIMQI